MADALPESTLAALEDPFAQLTGPLASTTRLDFEVVDSARLTPHMQRLRLTAPQLDRFGYLPGQDVMLLVAAEGTRPVRRRYTIRQLDQAARLLTLDIVLHGDGPGERWVRSARSGDRIEGIGPRGKITTSATADWHLFIGDESALPATFAMTGALPPDRPATLVLEIPDESDEQDLDAAATIRISWLHRRLGVPAGDPSALAAEAAEIELPPGRGHAYLFGEATVVSRLREVLAAREELAGAELAVRDAQIEALAAQVEELRRRLDKDSLLTEQGRVFPQLEGLAGGFGLYGHRSWLRSGIGILRRWWCRCRVRWWRPGTGMSRSG